MKQLLRISLIQTDLFWEDKKANLEMLQEKIEIAGKNSQIVFLPEMFSTGFSMQPYTLAEEMDGETILWMKTEAAKNRIILCGTVMIKENNHYYNRLMWVLPTGELAYYNKRHCFAFANEHLHYTPGNSRLITQVNGWKLNLQICYDLRFPVWARQQMKDAQTPEYDVLVYLANWPQRRSNAWKTLLAARAIENQCYVIGVNRIGADGNGIEHSGDSCIINPLGAFIYHKENDEAIFSISLEPQELEDIRKKLPFLSDADQFNIHL
jgi:omega-amidase